MSDYADNGHRSRLFPNRETIESHLMFAACFVLFLCQAFVVRIIPWREQSFFRRPAKRLSIFGEAKSAASECVASSFMGL
ncbi:hypothetical protein [Afipia sp. DC4300-2b1]|uniref:hypothetical protein n=1 Tax=Afipia sp. DC4300-2b1 TaxID=2804672 RepID=UPI003CEE3130